MSRGDALYLLESPLVTEIFDGLEKDAMETAIFADASDDDTRFRCMRQIEAIRELRRKLKAIADGKTKPGNMSGRQPLT